MNTNGNVNTWSVCVCVSRSRHFIFSIHFYWVECEFVERLGISVTEHEERRKDVSIYI